MFFEGGSSLTLLNPSGLRIPLCRNVPKHAFSLSVDSLLICSTLHYSPFIEELLSVSHGTDALHMHDLFQSSQQLYEVCTVFSPHCNTEETKVQRG